MTLKPGKAVGPDNIPIWILKICTEQIAPVLQVHNLPNDWLSANIIPVFKKGDKSFPSNYQPMTVVCCKVMEHIIIITYFIQLWSI